jgi:uncharacterized protein (UPF0264 family)
MNTAVTNATYAVTNAPYTVTNAHSGLHGVQTLDAALKLVANADDAGGRVFDAEGRMVADGAEDAYRLWVTLRALYGAPR